MGEKMSKDYKYKFSIIIPVYDVEDYIEETIESVVNQTIGIENIQIIFINDGSPDNSEEICLKYKEQYPDNITYIKQENAGVSAARNKGKEYAEGKYINFLDSDDKWSLNALETVYNFFENENNDVDVVACMMEYFEARTGLNHPLNFKFTADRVIDITKEPNLIQMHAASCFFKHESINDVEYSRDLKYAEDSLFVNKVILKKKRYGVLKSVTYLYRKRFNETSALDKGRTRPVYYNPTLENFHKALLSYAKEEFKERIPYIEHVVMYELQWRLKTPIDPEAINGKELDKYKKSIKEILTDLDDKVILEATNLSMEHKLYALRIKHGDKFLDKCLVKDGIMTNENNIVYSFNENSLIKIYVINIYKDTIQIAGKIDSQFAKDNVYIEINGEKKKLNTEDSVHNTRFGIEDEIYKVLNFNEHLNNTGNLAIKILIKYKDEYIELHPAFAMGGRLNQTPGLTLHYNDNGYMCYYENNAIKIEPYKWSKSAKLELKVLWYLLKKRKLSKMFYRVIGKILKTFKRNEIWFVSDRTTVANDNGMHLFKYINSINHTEKVYFIIDKKSKDYEKMKKIGNVIAFNSFKYKMYFFIADKIISSQADHWVLDPYGKSEWYYRDMFNYDFVFLQHGVTKDDISSWLNIYNKNIKLFVTSSIGEYKSVLEGTYGYDEDSVKLTGMPRFDNLYDESKKMIAIMPTWRKALSGHANVNAGTRDYNPAFKESEYFNFYNNLINDERLLKVMRENNYKGIFLVHPSHKENSCDFEGNDVYTVLDDFADYQKLFREAKLVVSDFSSVPFDFAYLYKPVLYAQFDRETFFEGHIYKEGYFDYERDGFGPVTYNYEDTLNEIIKFIKNDCELSDKYRKRINKFYKYHDKENCKRVYDEIKKIK